MCLRLSRNMPRCMTSTAHVIATTSKRCVLLPRYANLRKSLCLCGAVCPFGKPPSGNGLVALDRALFTLVKYYQKTCCSAIGTARRPWRGRHYSVIQRALLRLCGGSRPCRYRDQTRAFKTSSFSTEWALSGPLLRLTQMAATRDSTDLGSRKTNGCSLMAATAAKSSMGGSRVFAANVTSDSGQVQSRLLDSILIDSSAPNRFWDRELGAFFSAGLELGRAFASA